MRMEARLKGMSDSRIRIPSAHLGSGPHAWPDPVTQTPNGNVEIEESEMHRLVRHGSKETGHTARAATRITVEQGTRSAVELKYTKPQQIFLTANLPRTTFQHRDRSQAVTATKVAIGYLIPRPLVAHEWS